MTFRCLDDIKESVRKAAESGLNFSQTCICTVTNIDLFDIHTYYTLYIFIHLFTMHWTYTHVHSHNYSFIVFVRLE